jgi:hypothetical protein
MVTFKATIYQIKVSNYCANYASCVDLGKEKNHSTSEKFESVIYTSY